MTTSSRRIDVLATVMGILLAACTARAGSLDSPAAPTNAGSAMYTVTDLYNRLDTGAAGVKRAGSFVEPSGAPGSTGKTLDEIMAKTPSTNANAAAAGEVVSGKTYWGLSAGAWGTNTGTMANNGTVHLTPGTSPQPIAAGYHSGSGDVAGDGDLMTGNIRAGVNIFGVAGDANVVNTATGDATAADIANGKKAWVDGAEVTGTVYPAPVAKTGQTTSYATGDDGDLEPGVAWPNPRFTDNGNGTVTDNLTGLIWLKNANFMGATRTWDQALTDCATLNSGEGALTDSSVEGDWRLPSVQELQSLIHYGVSNPALPNTAGTVKWTAGDPFTGVQTTFYWSSTTYAITTTGACIVHLGYGDMTWHPKSGARYVWPVRGGQ